MKKKILAITLCLCMAAVLLPTVAFAAVTGEIQLVDSESNSTGGIAEGNTLYFGIYTDPETKQVYEVSWMILHTNTLNGTNHRGDANVLPMLSVYTICEAVFQPSGSGSYADSPVKEGMETIYNGFGVGEQNAVAETSLGRSSISSDSSLTGQRLFPLAYNEYDYINSWWEPNNKFGIGKTMAITGHEVGDEVWWLRTASRADLTFAYIISNTNAVPNGESVMGQHWLRPACCLDLSKILFTSAADGKNSGMDSGAGLTQVSENTPKVWKLTLVDDERSDFSAETTGKTGDILTVSYDNAVFGENEFISAIIEDADGAVTYYGRIAKPTQKDGTADIDLSGLTISDTDTLYVFSEQYNGDNKTDYASELKAVAFELNSSSYRPSAPVHQIGAPVEAEKEENEENPNTGAESAIGAAAAIAIVSFAAVVLGKKK